jgi:hypothetical protein
MPGLLRNLRPGLEGTLMTAKTMAEVLAKHARRGGIRNLAIHCDCGWSESIAAMRSSKNSFAAHQAAALSAAGFGLVADTKAEALEEAADDFEGNVGVGEFAELSTRDGNPWGHVEESWEHQGPYMDWLRNRAAALRGNP